jgi:hypothetical protein
MVQGAIALGAFANARFVSFRSYFSPHLDANPNFHRRHGFLSAARWLAVNANDLGLTAPPTPPQTLGTWPILAVAGMLDREAGAAIVDPTGDGPVGLDGFSWRGRRHNGMPKPVARLIRFLWETMSHTADFREITKQVFHDRDTFTGDSLGTIRKQANAFFAEAEFPFRIRTAGKPS